MEPMFLGESVDYWLELQNRCAKQTEIDGISFFSYAEIVRENAKLRAKASYFDNELVKMTQYNESLK